MRGQINYLRLALKTLLTITLLSFAVMPALSASIGELSLYNWLLPGRDRFPFSDTPQKGYNLSLNNLDAMFASHKVAAEYDPGDEFRIFILGDSSTWGTLLKPEETLAGQLNQLNLVAEDGRALRFYNLGYPTLSLTKDLMLLQVAMDYQPDLIVWLFTLESFPVEKQLTSPLVENNLITAITLLEDYDLDLKSYGAEDANFSYWDNILINQRRNLADIIRLQLYGVMWSVTGIDQYYPEEYQEAARDLADDISFYGWQEGDMTIDQLSLDLLITGKEIAGDMPIIYVNEPILISEGLNNDLRYNFYYPRWAYDQYREILATYQQDQVLTYFDYWDLVPAEEYTNTAIHTTPEGVKMLVDELSPHILKFLTD
jgi:hypothetical protein